MAFELANDETVGEGVRRIVDEQLAEALEDIQAAQALDGDQAVHSVRKRFKRVRALLRMVRDDLGEEVYQRENRALRDAAGTLSAVRDATVLLKTLKDLKGCVEEGAYRVTRKRLLARRRTVQKRVLEEGQGLEAVAETIQSVRRRVSDWPIASEGWDAIEPGLKRTYKSARSGFRQAEVGGPPRHFHEWRKRTKALWHQFEALAPIWPEVMKKLADEAHALADTLGQEHDLSVLRDVLDAQALSRAEAPSEIRQAVEAKRAELGGRARAAGERLFAERPKAFVGRLSKYWKASMCPDSRGCEREHAAVTSRDVQGARFDGKECQHASSERVVERVVGFGDGLGVVLPHQPGVGG